MNKTKLIDSLDSFTRQYLKMMLWSSTDNSNDSGGKALDENCGIKDITIKAIKESIADCEAFQEENKDILKDYDSSRAGNDFWLTRNGHGAGYWDGDYQKQENDGKILTKSAKVYGGIDPHVYGGKVHF